MKTEARLVVRGCSENDGLIVGVRIRGSSLLHPGRVYEIREVMGDAVLVDVGPSAVKNTLPDYEGKPYSLCFCWGNTVGHLLSCHPNEVFLTEREATDLFSKGDKNASVSG